VLPNPLPATQSASPSVSFVMLPPETRRMAVAKRKKAARKKSPKKRKSKKAMRSVSVLPGFVLDDEGQPARKKRR
jgi:hypothetical protein